MSSTLFPPPAFLESASTKEQEIFLLAIQALPNALIAADREGKIVLANARAEQLFGYEPDELEGKAIELLLPKALREKHASMRAGFFQEKNARAMGAGRDLTGLRKDGSEVPIEIGLSPIQTSEYQLVLASIVDISERKRDMDARLIQIQKLESLGVMAGSIAHDFNNLLTSILGYTDLARQELAPDSIAGEYIGHAIKGIHSAADVVRQLLAYSGRGAFVVEPLQISDVAEEMGNLLQVSISKKCVLNYQLEKDLPSIDADSAQLRQIIMNLIINASDAIGTDSGTITVSTGQMFCDRSYLANVSSYTDDVKEGLYVYLDVSDTGCGMDADTIVHIFDPFFTTKTSGRGLGLAAVLGIVRGHGGFIKLRSEPGKGTAFRVLFPPSRKPAVEKLKHPDPENHWHGKGLALIVDDEATVRSVAKAMLEKMGFDVITAENGKAGVELFRQRQDDITFVLMDMTMPDLNGAQTFQEMKKTGKDVKVILSSGYDEHAALAHFSNKDLTGFIQKPYRYEDLLNVVKKIT